MFKVSPYTRLSEHFILADFLGCQSVYSKGYANIMPHDGDTVRLLDNGKALCAHGLEAVLERVGPISISYGYISDALSRQIVKYQDPTKPSHHRWDLGAAADFIAHDVVTDEDPLNSAPIMLAHQLDQADIPYSRIITYSESPCVCLAVSADEVDRERPRRAFYENRYMGVPKVKPDYRSYSTSAARSKAFKSLVEDGLPFDWSGAGYPTHHGGGFRQFHHMRVSQYTMVSDWLRNLQSIAIGAKNVPSLNDERVQDAFAAAGITYDLIIRQTGIKYASIVAGYTSHLNPFFDASKDWRSGRVFFSIVPPESLYLDGLAADLDEFIREFGDVRISAEERQIDIEIEVDYVLEKIEG